MTGCGAANGTTDDVATNDGGSQTESETGSGGISKDNIKVGVLYISDPSEGSGYSYTHDLGVKGMQSNLGLKEDQIERKIVVIAMLLQRRKQSSLYFGWLQYYIHNELGLHGYHRKDGRKVS